MPLLRKQPFVSCPPPQGIKPEDEVFYCETTGEVFTDYEAFFERTILCNSLVWSCAVTGKSNFTYEEAVESEKKSKKKISNLPKSLKRGLLYLVSKTKRGRQGEVTDDVYDWAKARYFKGEIVDAVIGNQWCESKILRVVAPTEAEIAADAAEQEDEVQEVNQDGSPKKVSPEIKKEAPADHLFKYEVQETEPDDEDMIEVHIIEADDIKREKGMFTRDKLNLYLKNVLELDGVVYKLKAQAAQAYSVSSMKMEDVFAGPEPEFEESLRKIAAIMNKKKGQCTLDGWATATAAKAEKKEGKEVKQVKEAKVAKVAKPKKQTPEEIEEEMRKLREAQAKYREEAEKRKEEMKKKRIEDRAREKQGKLEEKKLVKELMAEWSSRREDLDCEDLRDLPTPTPVRCRIPNQLTGEFLSILEFTHSFSEILELKDSYPGQGVTFQELEKALTETDTCDGAFFDLLTFMLVTVFDLQLEEEEEAKADTDKTVDDLAWAGDLGKDEVIAGQIRSATETAAFSKQNLGLSLREVHLDPYSITEVLRLHLEGSGGYRGYNLQNWRHYNRGGFHLQDDPGFQFCLDEPQILGALRDRSVFELPVADKLKIMGCMVNQMLSFAGVRDEVDARYESVLEARAELREVRVEENKRIKEQEAEEKMIAKEERKKLMEEKVKEIEAKKQGKNKALEDRLKKEENQEVKKEEVKEEVKEEAKKETVKADDGPRMTSRQLNLLKEKEKEQEKQKDAQVLKEKEAEASGRDRMEQGARGEFFERERDIQERLADFQGRSGLHCLGRDRAFRRFWVFDAVPGLFVEHDDSEVGECRDTPTPWDPEAGPITEVEATAKARRILQEKAGESVDAVVASPSSDKENSSGLGVTKGEAAKTYSRKNPVLVQKVLSFNKEEVKPSPVSKQQEEEEKMETESDSKPSVAPWGRCLASGPDCPVHSSIQPRTHWAYYSTAQQVDSLVAGLNPRGEREGELRERLVLQRDRIEKRIRKCQTSVLTRSEEDAEKLEAAMVAEVEKRRAKAAASESLLPLGTGLQETMELALRDQVLELEEKIFVGALGFLKVDEAAKDQGRIPWRQALENRGYAMGRPSLEWGEGGVLEAAQLEGEDSRSGSPVEGAVQERTVRQLAAAILQVQRMISQEDVEKYLKEPLGEDEKERKKRLKKEEERKKKRQEAEETEENEEEEEKDEKPCLTPLKRWESSLLACTTISQLFVHLTTLDTSIVWSKSIMNTKCRLCRRKTDPDRMLLCDGCDRGHHMYCLKPKMKVVPEGDWFCLECKPKERTRSPKKQLRRSIFNTAEEDTEEEAEDEEDDEEEPSPPARKTKARRKLVESEDEEEEAPAPKKGSSRSRKKVVESEEEEEEEEESPPPKKGKGKKEEAKKGGLANLFGRRKAAVKGDEKRREEKEEDTPAPKKAGARSRRKVVESEDEEEEEEEVPEKKKSSRAAKGEENKENSRAKRSRRSMEEEEEDLDLNIGEVAEMINALIKHKDGWPFDRPISKQEAPDYHLHVKTPMDLQTIRTRLDGMAFYTRNQQIINDIRLVFSNCIQYNQEDAEEYKCAQRLEKVFDKELKKVGLVDEEQFPKNTKAKKRRT